MGPACADVDVLRRLFEAGADVCRLNFSHGTLDQHLRVLQSIRQAAAHVELPVAVLGDLCGPKIRLGEVADSGGAGGMSVEVGDELVFERDPIVASGGRISSTYRNLVDDVQVGDRLYVEDGLLRFVCTEKSDDEICCRCTAGGVLKTAKGINLPDSHVSVPSITERDWQCADWAVEHDLDYLALSFVRRSDDLQLLRQHLRNKGSSIQLIAKIEKAEAVRRIDSILEASDGLMVARGDLGVEMDVAQVPILQKDLIRRCQTAGKPVIVATQMLQSMIEHASPTRAEVSDVSNAIFDGTDAVMLSGETAVGKFPVGTVLTMAHLAEVTEEYLIANPLAATPGVMVTLAPMALRYSAAAAAGAIRIVCELKASLVVVWSQTGATARIFSKTRFPVPIVALSSDPRALRRMALHFGVIPQELTPPGSMYHLVNGVDALVVNKHFAKQGDRIVIVAGAALGTPGTLNGIVVHTVGERWPDPSAAGSGGVVSTRLMEGT
jgi:pyruvate kinase